MLCVHQEVVPCSRRGCFSFPRVEEELSLMQELILGRGTLKHKDASSAQSRGWQPLPRASSFPILVDDSSHQSVAAPKRPLLLFPFL